MKLTPFSQRSDGSAKGDWDVGIVLDFMERAETAEVIVLTSGAGDFDLLVNKIRGQYGKQLKFMAPRR
nr:NYN domain-containing protein [Halomonas sp. 18H]